MKEWVVINYEARPDEDTQGRVYCNISRVDAQEARGDGYNTFSNLPLAIEAFQTEIRTHARTVRECRFEFDS